MASRLGTGKTITFFTVHITFDCVPLFDSPFNQWISSQKSQHLILGIVLSSSFQALFYYLKFYNDCPVIESFVLKRKAVSGDSRGKPETKTT
jgi:hypothetical protein